MMRGRKSNTSAPEFSRRQFLFTAAATAPTLSLLEGQPSGSTTVDSRQLAGKLNGKFTPVNLGAYFNCSSREFGTREQAALIGGESCA